MNTTEVLAGGAGLVAGGLLGSLVLAPAPIDVPLWGSGDRDSDALVRLRDRLKQEGMAVTLTGLRGSQMTGVGLGKKGETFNLLLVKKNDFDKAFQIANQMLTPEAL